MTVICKDDSDNYTVNVKGALDVILPKCNKILDNGIIRDITTDDTNIIYKANDTMADNALRVLGFAYKETDSLSDTGDEDLIFVGSVGIIDPPRPE